MRRCGRSRSPNPATSTRSRAWMASERPSSNVTAATYSTRSRTLDRTHEKRREDGSSRRSPDQGCGCGLAVAATAVVAAAAILVIRGAALTLLLLLLGAGLRLALLRLAAAFATLAFLALATHVALLILVLIVGHRDVFSVWLPMSDACSPVHASCNAMHEKYVRGARIHYDSNALTKHNARFVLHHADNATRNRSNRGSRSSGNTSSTRMNTRAP